MKAQTALKHAWSIFSYQESPKQRTPTASVGFDYRNPTRIRYTRGNERTIVTSVCNRLSLDASAISIRHVRLDKEDRFIDFESSMLDNCLNVEANIDQSSRLFIQDIVASMLDEGCVAVVPTVIDTDLNNYNGNSFDICEMRTGKIVAWKPDRVTVLLYNDRTGNQEEITLPKSKIAIIENPLYAIMNEPNSTMQRLVKKLALMDHADEAVTSGSLDLIVQLPYAIKNESRRAMAEERRKNIEDQLNGAKYGVAYMDGTERLTQLNRPIENNLMKQIEYLTGLLYSQLGITQSILDGTADEQTMNNYYNRTIEAILSAIVDEFRRKFLTKTARTQKQDIKFFRDPFKLMPVGMVAEIADKFTRNEIMSSNEFRGKIGMKPSSDPAADELRNKNLSQSKDAIAAKSDGQNQNEENDEEVDIKKDKE